MFNWWQLSRIIIIIIILFSVTVTEWLSMLAEAPFLVLFFGTHTHMHKCRSNVSSLGLAVSKAHLHLSTHHAKWMGLWFACLSSCCMDAWIPSVSQWGFWGLGHVFIFDYLMDKSISVFPLQACQKTLLSLYIHMLM